VTGIVDVLAAVPSPVVAGSAASAGVLAVVLDRRRRRRQPQRGGIRRHDGSGRVWEFDSGADQPRGPGRWQRALSTVADLTHRQVRRGPEARPATQDPRREPVAAPLELRQPGWAARDVVSGPASTGRGPVAHRWLRYEVPLMVRVDVDDDTGHAEITRVVLALERDDLYPVRGRRDDRLVHDERFGLLEDGGPAPGGAARPAMERANRAVLAGHDRDERPHLRLVSDRYDEYAYDDDDEYDEYDEHDYDEGAGYRYEDDGRYGYAERLPQRR
jgi:hypothetical protein